MCFYVHEKYFDKLIAEEDVSVVKSLDEQDLDEEESQLKTKQYITPWFNMKVEFNTLLTSKLDSPINIFDFWTGESVIVINKGLHSLAPSTTECLWASHLFKAIIPKGSEYYYNPAKQEYVSNQLVITDEQVWKRS